MLTPFNFESFPNTLNVAVIGANGGIGTALIEALSDCSQVDHIFALSRQTSSTHHAKVLPITVDILDEQSIAEAVSHISLPLDIVVIATGVLCTDTVQPEKKLNDINLDSLNAIFSINTFAPILVAKHFLPLLRKQQKSVLAALSARVGSISDNNLGGWYSYRASKAALNMLLKTTSIEVARRNKMASVIGLHPGTVDTGLSKPFQANVKPEKLFRPEFAAECILKNIDKATAETSGSVFAWDGSPIPY